MWFWMYLISEWRGVEATKTYLSGMRMTSRENPAGPFPFKRKLRGKGDPRNLPGRGVVRMVLVRPGRRGSQSEKGDFTGITWNVLSPGKEFYLLKGLLTADRGGKTK